MASNFIYSSRDHKFILKEWLKSEKILGLPRFSEYLSLEDIDQILDQGLKACREVVAPSNDDGDTIGAVYKDGKVTLPHKAYRFAQENGWGSSNKDIDSDGILPGILSGAAHEYMVGANPAITSYVGLGGGTGRAPTLSNPWTW